MRTTKTPRRFLKTGQCRATKSKGLNIHQRLRMPAGNARQKAVAEKVAGEIDRGVDGGALGREG